MQFFQKILLTFTLIITLTSHKCLVYSSGSSPGDTIAGGQIPASGAQLQQQKAPAAVHHASQAQHQHQQQQHQQQQQQPHHHPQQYQHQYSSHGIGGGGLPHHQHPSQAAIINSQQHQPAVYHQQPSHSGHAEPKNTYNLLSEAMSQAVSNEFSSLGSGSADGACHADDIDCYNVQDRLGMEAIRTLHQQLDDDDNGNIDLSESDDFLREELKYDSGYEKRQKAFHFNDDMHISVKELWEAWLRSEVHNWTIEQTTDWLAQSVQLPQYVDLFKQHKVSGAALPRLAVNNMHYVSNVLGIKDPIHKQKIALKAMDVVLFGPPRETGTRWKDYILVTLLLSAIIGCWYAYQQNKNAKRHLRRMAQDMEGLQRAEQSLQEMQKELERARLEQENVATEKMDLERRLKEVPTLTSSNSDLEVQQLKKEIEMLRTELSRAEIELVDNCWAPPPQLQSWLQYTYELESKNHLKKRVAAERQLQSAREACEKLRKKRSSLVGAFVSTHGKSIDDVDRSIVEARNSLGEVTNELQERLHRWKQIEQCLGMNIVNNNGLSYLESVLYGRNGGGSSIKSSRGRITSSSDELDDESVQEILYIYPGIIDGYNRNSALSGSAILNSSSNTVRDESSGSEDNVESQSVQFYLGTAPTATISASAVTTPVISQRTPLPTPSPLEAYNHIGGVVSSNHAGNVVNSSNAAAVTAASSASYNDSPLLRSQSSDLMTDKDLYTLLGRPQPRNTQQTLNKQAINNNNNNNNSNTGPISMGGGGATAVPTAMGAVGKSVTVGGGNKTKKMVKQHSTASQQSTSSTSSSVQSAPEQGAASSSKQQSPSRFSTSSLERQLMQQHQYHQHLLNKPPKSVTPMTFPSLDRDFLSSVSTLQSAGSLKSEDLILAATHLTDSMTNISDTYHSDTQLNKSDESAAAGGNGTVKKRKKGLRFGFGSKKSISSSSDTSTKSKNT
ncbi:stromal interaction molecule homolog isoform X3 [Musca domestica]|uniref:Stromal interaction molecule homolog isoform X3 n=1 Tax=Musca domestica TaxID=7370 RepID=A0ABM3UW26_MUSDO|nr:stromal interaction molecule homolog isoform X3 [Musca domestica]